MALENTSGKKFNPDTGRFHAIRLEMVDGVLTEVDLGEIREATSIIENATVNVGDVGIVNTDEQPIDPATSDDIADLKNALTETTNPLTADVVEIDDTEGGQDLETLGVTISASLKKLTILPHKSNKAVNWAIDDDASADTAIWPGGGASIDITAAVAESLTFFATEAVNVTIIQEG